MFAGLGVESSDSDNTSEVTELWSEPNLAELLESPLDSTDARRCCPRGFENQRSNCFLNTVIQSLFSLDLFRALLQRLAMILEHLDYELTPVCFALHLLYQQLCAESDDDTSWKCSSIYPSSLDEIVSKFSKNVFGRHEDAQEFLHYLIDNVHEELVKLKKGCIDPQQQLESLDVGFVPVIFKRNRRPVIINQEKSLVSQIFGGQLKCCISKNQKRSVPESQQYVPFFSLQLPINPVKTRSLLDAFLSFVSADMISGIRKGQREVNAFQTSHIHSLPPVLTLHLERFTFDGSTVQKIHRHVAFNERFAFPDDACTNPLQKVGPHFYKLRSIICHVGQSHSYGHYTSFFRDKVVGWVLADDCQLTRVKWADVRDQQAYLLFYELETSK